jgi:hypothetical protein
MAHSAAFAALREALDIRHRPASMGVPVPACPERSRGALTFPKGAISTLEGAASSGRSALAAHLLAEATRGGAGAIVSWRDDPGGSFFPPSLQKAGVVLERLLVVRVEKPLDVMRAADILLRSAAFRAIVIPAVSARAAVWSRLASLAHRANAVLVALGCDPCDELRYFASLRVDCALERIDWIGAPGPFRALAGYDVRLDVRKHKRAMLSMHARVAV